MAAILEKYPNIHFTVNLTSSAAFTITNILYRAFGAICGRKDRTVSTQRNILQNMEVKQTHGLILPLNDRSVQ